MNMVNLLLRFLGDLSLPMRGCRIGKYLAKEQVHKLHIGCGFNVLEGWLNTELNVFKKGTIYVNATRRLPFKDATFDYVFSEHFIEHISYSKGKLFLQECFRILRPKGRIRIATPDLQFLIDLYRTQKSEVQENYIRWATNRFLPSMSHYQDTFVINNFFRAWGHQFVYDFKILRAVLEEVGFRDIRRYRVGESDDEQCRNLERHGTKIPEEFNQLETMAVEAIKP